MPSDRVTDIRAIAGTAPSSYRPHVPGAGIGDLSRPAVGRFDSVTPSRTTRFALGARDDRTPPPRRVTFDGKRQPRVQPAAVVSALQLADFACVLIAGIASLALQSAIAWPLSFLPCAAAALVLGLMMRRRSTASREQEVTSQHFATLLVDGVAHMLATFGFALVIAVAVLEPTAAERAPLIDWLLSWAAIATAGIVVVHGVLAVLQIRWRNAGRLKQIVAIYGTGDLAERLVERLSVCPDIEIVGVFDDRAGRGVIGKRLRALAHGTTADLVEMSRLMEIDRIVVALPHSAEKRLLEILRKLHKMPVEISLAPDMVGFHLSAKGHVAFGGLPLLDVYGKPLTFGQNLVKTMFDRVVALAAVVVLSPVLLLLTVAIKLDSRGPVLFRQNRYGFGDRVIQVFKFRTMRAETSDANGEKQTERDDPRLTRIGGFLRKWSLDELPQLLNVLRGELSLVGPRPHAVSMRVRQRRNEDIVPDYALRHHVKPGITGWAQVNGCHGPVDSEMHLHRRVAYDLDYINHWSLWFDIRIILKTAQFVVGRRAAY